MATIARFLARREQGLSTSENELREEQLEQVSGGWPIDWGKATTTNTATNTTTKSNYPGQWIEIYSYQ
jgi:hypothetical protein